MPTDQVAPRRTRSQDRDALGLAPHRPRARHPGPGPCRSVLQAIGDTPLIRLSGFLESGGVDLYLKFEAANPGGSTKDRPTARMIEKAIRAGEVGPGAVVIESSSGNTGIGLAQVCRYYGLRFICVVDRRATPDSLRAMQALGAEVDRVPDPVDGSGNLLEARLARVKELLDSTPGAFWPNQYANRENPAAHAAGTMAEIDRALAGTTDVVFTAVGSTGTLVGCQDFARRKRRPIRVVAVDAVGSILFGGTAGPRHIPGMGAGVVPPLAANCREPEVARVTDLDCVVGCRRVALTDALLVGGSSGGILQAVRRRRHELAGLTCVVIAPDSGHRYLDTVFDDAWVQSNLGCPPDRVRELVGPPTVRRLPPAPGG